MNQFRHVLEYKVVCEEKKRTDETERKRGEEEEGGEEKGKERYLALPGN
jgi:hypothetical protein